MVFGRVAAENGAVRMRRESPGPGGSSSGAILALLVTLGLGILGQGGFYLTEHIVIGVGLGVSVVASIITWTPRSQETDRALLLAVFALGLWTVMNNASRGDFAEGASGGAVALAVMVVLLVVRRSTNEDRELIVVVLPVLGGMIAVTAWIGLVLHLPGWSLQARGIWRAAGALTYPNAAAAVLVPLSLLAIARSGPEGAASNSAPPEGWVFRAMIPPWVNRLLATVMVMGVGATLSRGGVLALVVGLGAAFAMGGQGMRRASAGPLAGGVIGVTGVLPAMTSEGPQILPSAVGALVAGLIVAQLVSQVLERCSAREGVGEAPSRERRYRRVLATSVVVLAVCGIAAGAVPAYPKVSSLAEARLSTGSTHRISAATQSLRQLREHPLLGVGSGRAAVTWRDPDGVSRTMRYVHNEYLQVLLEHGLIGGGLLLAVFCAGARTAGRRSSRARSSDERMIWAGGMAAVMAFAVHSAFDFLWHLPALPLLAATLFAVVIGPATRLPARQHARTPVSGRACIKEGQVSS
ncbi:MAG: hypothetical protein QG671_3599 [Actinomycetota bacterium]|nr:hypothetical protein [Actinomycetota bacterium]